MYFVFQKQVSKISCYERMWYWLLYGGGSFIACPCLCSCGCFSLRICCVCVSITSSKTGRWILKMSRMRFKSSTLKRLQYRRRWIRLLTVGGYRSRSMGSRRYMLLGRISLTFQTMKSLTRWNKITSKYRRSWMKQRKMLARLREVYFSQLWSSPFANHEYLHYSKIPIFEMSYFEALQYFSDPIWICRNQSSAVEFDTGRDTQ